LDYGLYAERHKQTGAIILLNSLLPKAGFMKNLKKSPPGITGRSNQTLKTDQDNAIIFQNLSESHQDYFLICFFISCQMQ